MDAQVTALIKDLKRDYMNPDCKRGADLIRQLARQLQAALLREIKANDRATLMSEQYNKLQSWLARESTLAASGGHSFDFSSCPVKRFRKRRLKP